ncbi:MAG: CHAT domain-containing protein, partial [bacterium]|nr:CHAT domain-containing protein [bacterium]
ETTEPGEIFIIPDKELFKLPFEALVTGYNQKELDTNVIFSEYAAADYFVQRYCVSYALSLFHFLKDPPSPRPKSYTIAAYGDPMTDEEGEDPRNRLFRPLPSSKKEILSIQTIFGESGSRVFLGPRFTQRHFETHAPRAEILHIATHFVNNLKHPQYSALLFSGRRQGFPLYYAHDIFKLKLNSRLVVLSACESSEKNLLGMQGLRGMTAAFRHAGARAMMVSMWPVDQQSSQLIPLFYKEYASKQPQKPPITTSRSLRAAKLKLMEKTDTLETGFKISFAHPFLWANYILYNFSY